MVTFGGAYAVLPYVSQQAVERYHWLQPPQMIDGLGLAETTPGPLIMVVQFIGFLGAWNQPGSLSPPAAASLGALLTTWVTFAPSFLWILLGAPHVEQLRSNRLLTSALTSITAAVVGVVLNLAVWFGIHALFPQKYRFDLFTLLLSAATFLVLVRWKPGITYVVFGSSAIGVLYRWLTAMN
jgi:chromate transporter